jgi:hypothetical protein
MIPLLFYDNFLPDPDCLVLAIVTGTDGTRIILSDFLIRYCIWIRQNDTDPLLSS